MNGFKTLCHFLWAGYENIIFKSNIVTCWVIQILNNFNIIVKLRAEIVFNIVNSIFQEVLQDPSLVLRNLWNPLGNIMFTPLT